MSKCRVSYSTATAMVFASMVVAGFASVLPTGHYNEPHLIDACDQNKRALLIGISEYKYWRPLEHVKREIGNVRDSLVGHGYCAHRNLNVKDATVLISTIKKFFINGKPSDTLLFFYSGHGDIRSVKNDAKSGFEFKRPKYYLVPVNGPKGQGDLPGRKIFLDYIVDADVIAHAVGQSQAKNIMVVLNTCHSGKFHWNNLFLASICPITTESRKRILITAGNDEQLVAADTRFSDAFLKSIDTMEPDLTGNRDGTVTLNEMVNYMGRQVEAHASQSYVPSSTIYPCKEQTSLPIREFFSYPSSSSRALLKLFKPGFSSLGFSGERKRLRNVVD